VQLYNVLILKLLQNFLRSLDIKRIRKAILNFYFKNFLQQVIKIAQTIVFQLFVKFIEFSDTSQNYYKFH